MRRSLNATSSLSVFTQPIELQSYHYLYFDRDIYSRKIADREVHSSETGKSASELMQRRVISEQCFRKPLVSHSANGSPMKLYTLQSKLADLEITLSYGRIKFVTPV